MTPIQKKEPMIEIQDLCFQYYGSSTRVLDNASLKIDKGEIVLIVGLSGSGKSTLLRTINGLIPHEHAGEYSGRVIVDGLEVAKTKMSELATKVGYIFQNPENQIFMFSVERDIAFGLENLGLENHEIRKRVDLALDTLGIRNLALRPPHELSDGQKQRVAIAGVLAMRPSILIFDEPTSLLDPYTARSLISMIKRLHDELGITVLIVEHRLDLVSNIADRMIVIDSGKIVLDGGSREVLYRTDTGQYGISAPAVVRLAKLLGLPSEGSFPINSAELARILMNGRSVNRSPSAR